MLFRIDFYAGTGMECYSEADYSAVVPEVRPYDMDNEYDRVMEAAETVNE